MNIVDYAVNEVKNRIPGAILGRVFKNSDDFGFSYTSIDEQIKKNIGCRVLIDANIIGGIEASVRTSEAKSVQQFGTAHAFQYDPSAWRGNSLISVIDFSSHMGGISGGCGPRSNSGRGHLSSGGIYSDAFRHAQYAEGQKTNPNMGGSTYIKLVGPNTIMIDGQVLGMNGPPNGTFTVLIGHDKDLADMNITNAMYFSDMVVEATKSYIYNTLILTLSEGDASRGFVLTSMSDIINDYRDSEERYQELRRGWGARAFENDPVRQTEFLQGQIGFLDIY